MIFKILAFSKIKTLCLRYFKPENKKNMSHVVLDEMIPFIIDSNFFLHIQIIHEVK